MRKLILLISLIGVTISNLSLSHASNVGGVFGPVVNEGDQTFQYRGAFDPDTNALVQRIHYQQSLNDDVRLRGVLQARRTDDSNLDFDFFQGEILVQLKDINSKWKHAVRVDARIADQNRRGLVAFTWTNHYAWSNSLSTTALVLGSVDVGRDSRSGVFLQTRANLSKKLNDRWKLSGEWFSSYGSTSDLQDFDEQTHQIGPALSGQLGEGWGITLGALFGANSISPDESLRFWLTKGF